MESVSSMLKREVMTELGMCLRLREYVKPWKVRYENIWERVQQCKAHLADSKCNEGVPEPGGERELL